MKTRMAIFALAIGVVLASVQPNRLSIAARAPASNAPSHIYAIRGAKIFTVSGNPVDGGTVVIRDGKIAAVGAQVDVPAGAEIIDASGLNVYPGMFDASTDLGLTEIGAVSATRDLSDVGPYNPQLIAMTAIHPASELIPVARENGITHALSVPLGQGVIPGQASAIHMAGWTIEQMLIRRSAAMTVNWPTLQTQTFDFATFSVKNRPFTEVKQEYDKQVTELGEWMEKAHHYAQVMEKAPNADYDRDLKLEALVPVVEGRLPLLVVANSKRAIRDAVEFGQKQHVKIIIDGGSEAYEVKDVLARNHVPVILGPTQSLPENEDAPYDQSFTTPNELREAGVKFAFGSFDGSFSRRLPYQAANAVAYGLPYGEALKSVTLYPAEILGLGDQLGSIETGKLADLIVTDGDPLSIPTQVKYLFINGELTSTDNRHRRLYEQYRKRP